MKKKLVLIFNLMLMVSFFFNGCTKKHIEEKNEKIAVIYGDCELDLNKIYEGIEELYVEADCVFEGEITEKKSYYEESTDLRTNYLFNVNKVYKGKSCQSIELDMLGGQMNMEEYLSLLLENEEISGSDIAALGYTDEQRKNGIMEIKVDGLDGYEVGNKCIVFAGYNTQKNKFYPIGIYQGVFCKDANDQYVRKLSETILQEYTDIKKECTLQELQNLQDKIVYED